MPLKSIIHEMRGSTSSSSSDEPPRRLRVLRLRSHRVVHSSLPSSSSSAGEAGGRERGAEAAQGSWAALPEEMLREVMWRIEEEEDSWPSRKDVVACAGVCRSWRCLMREIVASPEISGKITFPISLKQPGPRDFLVRCFIKRNRSNQTYHLFLGLTQGHNDAGKFLLAAKKCRRPTCTDYIISLDARDMSKGSSSYIGKLRSNFLGTKFIVYDSIPPHDGLIVPKVHSTRLLSTKVSPRVPAGNYPVAHIAYELNLLGSRGPRRMHCVMDSIPASAIKPGGVAPTQTDFPSSSLDSFTSTSLLMPKSSFMDNFISEPLSGLKMPTLVLKNKAPRWHEQLQCWFLNFHGRVTVASVKNFQLVAPAENGPPGPENEKALLQFGKVEKDLFTMDFCHPLSAFQAFAICLSSFDTKVACE